MAGKRQHYLPRFLLKGFASRVEGEKAFVWLFRKGASPVETSVRNVGLGKFFYGSAEESDLDDLITCKESLYGGLLSKIRHERRIRPCDMHTLAEFVVHMIARTRHTRSGFSRALSKFHNMMSRNLTDPDELVRQMIRHISCDREAFRASVREEIRNAIGVVPQALDEHLTDYVEASFEGTARSNAGAFAEGIDRVFKNVMSQSGEHGERAQKDALMKVMEMQNRGEKGRIEQYRSLHWQAFTSSPGSFILGDVAVIEMDPGTGEAAPPVTNRFKNGVVLLPVAHDLLLVGSGDPSPTLPSADSLNVRFAELSFEFFVTSQDGPREESYSRVIGKRSDLLEDREIEEIERDIFGYD
jgi:hypothetical protein